KAPAKVAATKARRYGISEAAGSVQPQASPLTLPKSDRLSVLVGAAEIDRTCESRRAIRVRVTRRCRPCGRFRAKGAARRHRAPRFPTAPATQASGGSEKRRRDRACAK